MRVHSVPSWPSCCHLGQDRWGRLATIVVSARKKHLEILNLAQCAVFQHCSELAFFASLRCGNLLPAFLRPFVGRAEREQHVGSYRQRWARHLGDARFRCRLFQLAQSARCQLSFVSRALETAHTVAALALVGPARVASTKGLGQRNPAGGVGRPGDVPCRMSWPSGPIADRAASACLADSSQAGLLRVFLYRRGCESLHEAAPNASYASSRLRVTPLGGVSPSAYRAAGFKALKVGADRGSIFSGVREMPIVLFAQLRTASDLGARLPHAPSFRGGHVLTGVCAGMRFRAARSELGEPLKAPMIEYRIRVLHVGLFFVRLCGASLSCAATIEPKCSVL